MGLVQRLIYRDCGRRFSESMVKINVTRKVGEGLHSGENNHEVGVASGDASYEKVNNNLSFASGEDVGSHKLTIVEKGLYGLPFCNSKFHVCAQKDAKNLEIATETKTVTEEEKQNIKGELVEFQF